MGSIFFFCPLFVHLIWFREGQGQLYMAAFLAFTQCQFLFGKHKHPKKACDNSRCNCGCDIFTPGSPREEDGDVLKEDEEEERSPQRRRSPPRQHASYAHQAREIEEDPIYASVETIAETHDNSYEDANPPTSNIHVNAVRPPTSDRKKKIDPVKGSGRSFNPFKKAKGLEKIGYGSCTPYATNGDQAQFRANNSLSHQSNNLGVEGGSKEDVHKCPSTSELLDSDDDTCSDQTNESSSVPSFASSFDLAKETLIPEGKTGMAEQGEFPTDQEAENQAKKPNTIGCLPEDNLVDTVTTEQSQSKEKVVPKKFRIVTRNYDQESVDSESFVLETCV